MIWLIKWINFTIERSVGHFHDNGLFYLNLMSGRSRMSRNTFHPENKMTDDARSMKSKRTNERSTKGGRRSSDDVGHQMVNDSFQISYIHSFTAIWNPRHHHRAKFFFYQTSASIYISSRRDVCRRNSKKRETLLSLAHLVSWVAYLNNNSITSLRRRTPTLEKRKQMLTKIK